MRNYRLTLILSPLLEEHETNDNVQQLASLIQEYGGILGEQAIKGKKSLASPIQGNKEGFLVALEFALNGEHVAALESSCKENPRVLRFLLAQQKRRKAQKPPQEKLRMSSVAEKKTYTLHAAGETEKIDLQGIDEKLEEIFKETPQS